MDTPVDETTPYRSISSMAVAAALAGGLSIAAVLGPALWIVPLVGAGLAVVALREIRREGSVKVGTVPALVGLGLAVGFGAQAVSQRVVHDRLVEARADAAVSEFVRALAEGRLADARSMCGLTALPAGRDTFHVPPVAHHAADSKEGEPLEAFAAMPAVAALSRCGAIEKATVDREGPPQEFPACFARLVRVSCRGGETADAFETAVRVVVERIDPDAWGSPFDRWRVVKHEQASGG